MSYFDGQISDDKKCARLISFETSFHEDIKKAKETESPLSFGGSDVKPSKLSGELEIHLSKKSSLGGSSHQYPDIDVSHCKVTKLGSLVDLAINQCIDVVVKIVKVGDVNVVKKSDGTELSKQDIVVSDSTGCCRLVLWEGDVDNMVEGKSYELGGLNLQKYGTSKYLSFSKSSTKKEIDDIGEVCEEEASDCEAEETYGKSIEGEITAVMAASEYANSVKVKCIVKMALWENVLNVTLY